MVTYVDIYTVQISTLSRYVHYLHFYMCLVTRRRVTVTCDDWSEGESAGS